MPATIGSPIANSAVLVISPSIALTDGAPSQTTSSAAATPAGGAMACGPSGRLHWGHAAAAVET